MEVADLQERSLGVNDTSQRLGFSSMGVGCSDEKGDSDEEGKEEEEEKEEEDEEENVFHGRNVDVEWPQD